MVTPYLLGLGLGSGLGLASGLGSGLGLGVGVGLLRAERDELGAVGVGHRGARRVVSRRDAVE